MTCGGEFNGQATCRLHFDQQENGTLYVGVTSDYIARIPEHKQDLLDGFTKRYGVHILVYIEFYDDMDTAIHREKQLKRWRRSWKIIAARSS